MTRYPQDNFSNINEDSEAPSCYSFYGHDVYIFIKDGALWFIAKGICTALGLENVSRAVARLDDEEKGITSSNTLGGKQDVVVVSEAGMYQLVLSSRKPIAKEFKRWICHEVIPSIRKTGTYSIQKTPIQVLAETTAHMADMERVQNQHGESIKLLQSDVFELGAEVIRSRDGDGHYMSVVGYANIKHLELARHKAQLYGKQASRLYREQYGENPPQVGDGRFGAVNTYPQSILAQVFGL